MRDLKLPWPGSGAAPHLHALAVGRIFQNARVAVAIGDEQPAVGPERNVGGAAKSGKGALVAGCDFAYRYLL